MEEEHEEHIESKKRSVNSKIIFVILLLIAVSVISYMVSRINYLRQQLVKQESQLLELKSFKDTLERQLQEANLKLAVLNSANNFLEKNTERLGAIREFLQSQLNMINEQLAKQQEIISSQQQIITSLAQANSKLDSVISRIGYLYLQSTAPASKGRKGKVDVFLSPAEEKR